MISTTFASQTVALLNDAPDWSSFSATFEALSQWDDGLSGREGRRPLASSIRAKVKFSSTLPFAAAVGAQQILRGYIKQPVLLPLWPMATTWALRAFISASGCLKVAYKDDWSQWELYTTTEPAWPLATDNVAPVMWGRLDDPILDWTSPSVANFDVSFVEDGPAAYQIQPNSIAFSAGPSLTGYSTAPKLWPFALNWSGDVPESFRVKLLSEQLGFGREKLETAYQATPSRKSSFETVLQSKADVWSLLSFFYQHGSGASFWAPTWRSAVVMAADIAGGSTTLLVSSAAGISEGDHLAFLSGITVGAASKVSSISGNTITLSTAPGAFSAANTVVSPLVLSRLDKPRLQINWRSADVALAGINISEVPPEYSIPSDETLGSTIGLLPTRAWIYEIAQTIGGVTTTTRLTSYEQDLTLSGQTYTARKIGHGQIRSSLYVDRDEVAVDSEVVSGDVLIGLATGKSEAPAKLTISRVDVSGSTASNQTVLCTGDIVGVSVRGSKLTAKVVAAGTVFDRVFPRFRMQVGCNHQLFSTGCGLSSASWKFTATIADPGSPGYPFTFLINNVAKTGGLPTIGSGYFAGGWIEIGSGASTIRRSIIDSTALSGGLVTLTLSRDPDPFPIIGTSVAIYPGCDGVKDTCSSKFSNYSNFGGHPFIPASNPSMYRPAVNVGGGKK